MALSEDDVRGIADYARIALEGDELTEMCAYLNDAVALGNAGSARDRSFRVPSILGEEE